MFLKIVKIELDVLERKIGPPRRRVWRSCRNKRAANRYLKTIYKDHAFRIHKTMLEFIRECGSCTCRDILYRSALIGLLG